MAETIWNIQEALTMVYKNPNKLLPGDAVLDWSRAWDAEKARFGLLVINVMIDEANTPEPPISKIHLDGEGLTGDSGAFKRNTLRRMLDEGFRYLKPGPDLEINLNLVTPKERKLGCEVLGEYFEAASTFVKSVSPTAGAAVEFLSYTKQLCKAAAKWL